MLDELYSLDEEELDNNDREEVNKMVEDAEKMYDSIKIITNKARILAKKYHN